MPDPVIPEPTPTPTDTDSDSDTDSDTEIERLNADIAKRDAERKFDLDTLSEASRVWSRAWSGIRLVKTRGPDMRPEDPPEAWAELLARAALSDAIALVVDGRTLGLAAHTAAMIRAILGDPEWAQASALFSDYRRADRDERTPHSVSAVAREPLLSLGNLASRMAADSPARSTITEIVQSGLNSPPPMTLADRLFREVLTEGVPLADAWDAFHAAQNVITAFAKPA